MIKTENVNIFFIFFVKEPKKIALSLGKNLYEAQEDYYQYENLGASPHNFSRE